MRHRTAAYLAAAWAIAFAAARTRIKDLIPQGASVFTGASETLRLSGIDAGINTSGRYQAVRPRVRAMDRVTPRDLDRRAQKVVPDLATALRRVEDHALPPAGWRETAYAGTN
jgi:hypothetical protein